MHYDDSNIMSCPLVNDPQRQNHWVTKNWNCAGTNSPEKCSASEVQIKVNTSPGCAWNGCASCSDKTQYICSPPYPVDTNTLWGCCSGSTSPYSCDPSYCLNSTNCDTFLQHNCTGNILFSNDGTGKFVACNSWCSRNPQACSAIKIAYCINNLDNPYCKAFAQEISNTGNSIFDTSVSKFCLSHPTDPFCSCTLKPQAEYNGSDPNLLALLNAPQCYDPTCISQGYENTSQVAFRKSGSCPTSICANTINVSDVSNSNISNVIAQCIASSTPTSSSTPTPSTPTPSTPSPGISKFILFVMVILFTVVFSIIYSLITRLYGVDIIAEKN